MDWRFAYDGLELEVSDSVSVDCSLDEDHTIQSAKDDSDINVLMRRFGVSGQLPVPKSLPFYGDFSDVTDYQSALHALRDAQDAFEELPSQVRSRFDNDPGAFLDFLNDPGNREEAAQLGLLRPEEPPVAPMRVEVVNPSVSSDPAS